MVYYSKISALGLGLFWDSLKKNPSDTWTHPPTSIVGSDFFVISDFVIFHFAKPLTRSSMIQQCDFSAAGPRLWKITEPQICIHFFSF